ncbi:MAG: hypothetical protein AAGF35_09550 [Pseudomonadota bacterium]
MSAIGRPEGAATRPINTRRCSHRYWLHALLVIPLLLLSPVGHSQTQGPKAAIAQYENCQRDPQCVKILKRVSAGDNKQAIKAQIRGGRIIWYEYNTRTGKVRRTN